VPRGAGTRPTSDRARATLYDWLGAGIEGERVLDLFAGTGALGIEALSRGAAHATFVERSRAAIVALRRNLAELELVDCSRVLPYDVRRAIGLLLAQEERFRLVLADPPYAGAWKEAQPLRRLLDAEGRLVVEHSVRDPSVPPSKDLVLRGSRAAGEAQFDCYEGAEERAE
jgi:16S rRNA (guanine(966)-N(2))-methyltransferase RsmD